MKVFCFDMDGTVLDSMPTLTDLAVEVIHDRFGLPLYEAREKYLATVGAPFVDQLAKIMPSAPLEQRIDAALRYETRHLCACPSFKLAPDIVDAMAAIRYYRYETALVTSTNRKLLAALPQLAALEFGSMDGRQDGYTKVHQLERLKRLYLRHQLILFGDSPSDAECAITVGAQFHLVTCDTVADTIYQVLRGVS